MTKEQLKKAAATSNLIDDLSYLETIMQEEKDFAIILANVNEIDKEHGKIFLQAKTRFLNDIKMTTHYLIISESEKFRDL